MKRELHVTIENGRLTTIANAKGDISTIYSIPYNVEALTIEQGQRLTRYIDENADEEYRAFMTGENVPTQKVWSSRLKETTRLVCGAIAEVSGFTVSAFEGLTLRQQRVFCDAFELEVIRPLYALGVYKPQGLSSFDFEGETYLLPKFSADGFGGEMPMAEETADTFAESNDLYLACENALDNMPLIVAILCRPEGEEYDEKVARERAEAFKRLPMSVALEVFFCKLIRMSTFLGFMGEHLEKLKAEAAKAEARA